MWRPGIGEIIVILFVVVLLFGAKRIPEIARALGRSLGEFKKGQKEGAEGESAEDKKSGKPGGDAASG
jgi:sec-independent protein translocase protein TatA